MTRYVLEPASSRSKSASEHNGHLPAVDMLLARGSSVNARETGDNTCPMHWAAAAGHLNVVRRLADAGGDVVGHGDDHELDVIGWATCWDGCDDDAHRAVADVLVSRGARHHIFSAIAMNLEGEVRRIVAADPSALNRRQSRNENNRTPLHFAVLKNRQEMISLLLELGADPWDHAASAITYTIPLPIVLYARAILPTQRRFWTAGAIGLTAFAIYGIASDALLGRPEAALTANSLIAIAFFAGALGWIFRPGQTPSRELRSVRVGVLAVSLTALADNLRAVGALAYPGPELEPFGFTVLVACLGTVAVWRVLGDARRLITLDRELNIARQIQSSILPQGMPRVAGLTVVARYRPMTAVAGDFYDFLEIDDQRVGILVADVSGHGVPAALIASMVKVALAAQREQADSPAAVLRGMNETLCGRLAGQYVTAAYLFIDTRSRVIRYGAAGHPPMLRATPRDGAVHEVEQNGLLLGFVEHTDYRELELSVHADERLLLYTDGLIEAANADDDLFGLERLKTTLSAAAGLQSEAVTDSLLKTVDAWSGQPPGDDLTIVLIDWAIGR